MVDKKKYWVETTYCIIAPEGDAEDYLFDKKQAIKKCKKLNAELEKYHKGFGYKLKKEK
jgi:hypothetical protein